jgi:hypothetical protein
MSDVEKGEHSSPKDIEGDSQDGSGEIDLQTYHETNAGRLVVDPA